MSAKLSKIKFFIINGDSVVVPKYFTPDAARVWYRRKRGEVFDFEVVSLTDKTSREKGAATWAQVIEAADFEPDDLPLFL